jgi:antitoxin (DNA-binding transcriptional repressor) of toxin-antitoxin stability system
MTIQVNIAEAKAKLSELVARAEAGEDVIISRDGKPVVSLTLRTPRQQKPRQLGQWDHLGLDFPESLFLGQDPEIEAWRDTWANSPIAPPE